MNILGRVHDDADHGMTPVEAVPSAGRTAANRPTVGKSADTILTLKKSLFDFGRERALSGRDTRANEEGLHTLEEHAEAMAREQGESTSSLVLAVGLALFEMAVVLVMDWVGGGLRAQYTEYKAKSEEYDRRLNLLQAAEREQAYQEGLLKEQQAITEDHVEHVRDRESRVRQLDSLVRGARQAVRDGYMAGLTETEGRIHGRG